MIERFRNYKLPFSLIKKGSAEKEKFIQTFERENEVTFPSNFRRILLSLTYPQLVEIITTIQSAYYWQERVRLLEVENRHLRERLNENQSS